jgi:DNA invertase Pin-like site-specific DNA recombinase
MGTNKHITAGQRPGEPLVLDSYARLSKAPDTGEFEKIETQWTDNRKVIDRLGGVLGLELEDGLSAWRKSVRRPGWEKLLERVRAGVSNGIVVWHTDRLFRQPRDLEALIDLADKGFLVASAHGSRDLADPDDRFILRIEVAHAARSSDDTSRRIKRRFRTYRENGVGHVGGPRRFGWPGRDLTWKPGPDETDEDRPQVPDALVERERRALVAAVDAVLSGVSDAVIAREWNAEGLLTAAGRTWVRLTVKSLLLRPTNAGLIESDDVLVATMPGEPLVDREKFERLRAKYQARRKGRVAGEVGPGYVGTGILRCGERNCGARMSARMGEGVYKGTDERRRYYTCAKERRGCGRVNADLRSVDRELKALVVARMSDSRHAAAVEAARAQVADRLTAIRAEIVECEALQAALSERLGRREITLAAFDRANEPLGKTLTGLYTERDLLSGGEVEGPTKAQPAAEIAQQWDHADISERRSMLAKAVGGSVLYLDKYVKRPGRRVFNRNRLRMVAPDGVAVTLGDL